MSIYIKTVYLKTEQGNIVERLAGDPAWDKTVINEDGSLGFGIYSMEGLLMSVFKLGMEAKER